MKKFILFYLTFVCFLSPINIVFGEDKPITREDIGEIQNQISNLQAEITTLKSLLQSYAENGTSNENRINAQLDDIHEKLSMLQESVEAGFTITWSFGNQQTWLSISYGITAALAVMLLSFFITRQNNMHIAKRLLNIDFSEINDELITKIKNLRSDITTLNENSQLVNDLVLKHREPREIMLNYIKGLFFGTYEATLSRMSDLDENELKKITRLHAYISGVDNLHELSIEPIVKQLEDIIESADSQDNKKKNVANILRQELEKRLNVYQIVYGKMHLELKGIKWIYLKELEQ